MNSARVHHKTVALAWLASRIDAEVLKHHISDWNKASLA